MKILDGRTPIQAEKYFNEGRTMSRNIYDPIMSEVYAKALEWKKKNVAQDEWGFYPIQEVAMSLIHGTL